jgi:hypothetical protein
MHERTEYLTWALLFAAGGEAGAASARVGRCGERLGGTAARRSEETLSR